MVGHGELHHARGALLLGQVQTSPALEHVGLGVLVCDSLELCTHRHSLQVGNIAAILQENLCIFDLELMGLGFGIGIRRRVLDIDRGDFHIVCGHREVDGLAVDIHRISGQPLLDLPIFEGHAIRLPCGKSNFLTSSTLFWLPVHGQGVGVLLVLCFQRDIVCGHLEADGLAGGVHISGQTSHFPTGEGLSFHRLCSNRNVLIKVTRFVHTVHGQGVGVLLVLRGQRDVVCGHREADGLAGGVRTLGHAIYLPTGEGMTFLLGCGKRDFLTKCTAFFLPVHGQGVVDRLIVVRHPHVIAGHEELEFDMRAGIGDGIRILCQTFDLPDNVIAFLLVNAKGDLIALIMLLAFLSIPVVVVLRLGRLGHIIGTYLFGGNSLIVVIRSYPDVHIVAAGGGGNRLALVGAVQQGHIRVGIVIIFAFVFHRVLGGIVGKVRSLGRVAESILTQINGAGLVLSALFCSDGYLITAIRINIGVPVDIGLALVYTGKALVLKRKLANAVCLRADQRVGVVPVPDGLKVLFGKALKGQLFTVRDSIGTYLINSVTIIGVGVSNVVLTRRHLDVHIVAAGGGGNRLALVGAVQQGHIRVGIVIIFAFVFHRVLGGIVGKVRSHRRIAERILNHNNRTGLVLFAVLCNDGSLIATIRILIGFPVDKGLALVYTGKALKLSREFANTVCRLANHRVVAVIVHIDVKVIHRKALKGQLFGYGVALRQLVIAAVVVVVILHSKPDVVGACLGGHSCRSSRKVICGAVLKGSLRDCAAIILRAVIGCSTGVEVKVEVPSRRPIFAHKRFLCKQNAAGCVPLAIRGFDVNLIAAVIGFGREVVKLCLVVGAHRDEAQLAHALLIAGNDRVLHSPLNRKVARLQGREGQLFTVRDSIGVHFVLGAIVVVTIIHHDADRVGTCLGRLRHRSRRAILRDILDGILRSIVKIHWAFIVCSLGLGVVLKVGAVREIFAYHLADIKRAVRVLFALFRYDALLVDAR